jgi:hypothetical protein
MHGRGHTQPKHDPVKRICVIKDLISLKTFAPHVDRDALKSPGEYPYVCTFPGHWRLMKGSSKGSANSLVRCVKMINNILT